MEEQPLCHRLKELRVKNRMTVREVSQAIGVSASTYREWEYGRTIKGEPYLKLAKVFKVSLTFLMTGKNTTPNMIWDRLNHIEKSIISLKKEFESFF